MTIIVAITLIHPILTFQTAKGVLKRKDSWQDDWVELCVIKWKTGIYKVAGLCLINGHKPDWLKYATTY